MSDEHAIKTHELSKNFGTHGVVRNLNLRVPRQTITALLGLNGAGKSTTIKMLLGLVRPTSGTGTVLDLPITDSHQSREMRRRVAYVAEDKRMSPYMTVGQLIKFTKAFYPDWRLEVERRLTDQFGLPLDRRVKQLSKGMRTKLALLLALSRSASLFILDEPSEGLDPVSVEELLAELVRVASEGATVLFSSHQIGEIERIADRFCIVNQGRLVLDSSLDDVRKNYKRIVCGFTTTPPSVDPGVPGLLSAQVNGRQVSLLVSHNAEAVVGHMRDLGSVAIDVTSLGLREILLQSVKGEGQSDLV